MFRRNKSNALRSIPILLCNYWVTYFSSEFLHKFSLVTELTLSMLLSGNWDLTLRYEKPQNNCLSYGIDHFPSWSALSSLCCLGTFVACHRLCSVWSPWHSHPVTQLLRRHWWHSSHHTMINTSSKRVAVFFFPLPLWEFFRKELSLHSYLHSWCQADMED